jgi:hypothetical protein
MWLGNVMASTAEVAYTATATATAAEVAAAASVAPPRWRIASPRLVPIVPPAKPNTVHTELASTSRSVVTTTCGKAAEAAALCSRPALTAASAVRKKTGPFGAVAMQCRHSPDEQGAQPVADRQYPGAQPVIQQGPGEWSDEAVGQQTDGESGRGLGGGGGGAFRAEEHRTGQAGLKQAVCE